jgi:hypothetical protein
MVVGLWHSSGLREVSSFLCVRAFRSVWFAHFVTELVLKTLLLLLLLWMFFLVWGGGGPSVFLALVLPVGRPCQVVVMVQGALVQCMRRPCTCTSDQVTEALVDSKSALDMMHDAPAVGQHCPVTAMLRHSVNS